MDVFVTKLLDELRGSWRFRWIGLGVAAAVCLIGWIYVLLIPSIYEASARVYVDTQSALRPLLQGLAVAPNVESSLAIVRQALLSEIRLQDVARQAGLDQKVTNAKEREALIESLRKRIVITADGRAAAPGTMDGLYRITFQEGDRGKSVAVVQSLLNSFVGDTLGSKRTGQEVAQRFLREQIADYEKRLADAEQRLADFKKRNVGKMPDQRGDYFARLQLETTALEDARKNLALAQARRNELQRQLSGEDPFIFGFDSQATAQSGPGTSDITSRIMELEAKEQELLLRYTEQHPEVIAVRDTLKELHERQSEELARMRKGRGTGALAQSTKANPVYMSMKIELNRTEVAVAELERSVSQQSAKVGSLRQVIDTVPQVEADVARLNRDYEVTRAQYTQLVQRLETAKISENADETGTIKFEIIDPPAAPLKPVSPNRTLLFSGVLFVGLAIGVGLTYLLNLLRPVFQNARTLAEQTGLVVIGSLSRTWGTDDRAVRRRDMMYFSGALGSLLIVFLVMLIANDAGAQLLARLTG